MAEKKLEQEEFEEEEEPKEEEFEEKKEFGPRRFGPRGEERGRKVEFKTVKAEEIKFGRNSFIEIARKIAVTPEGENEFVSISKGFYLPDGTKRFGRGKNVSIPNEPEVIVDIAKKLKSI